MENSKEEIISGLSNLSKEQIKKVEKAKETYLNERLRFMVPILKEMVPKDVESVLDVGSGCKETKIQYLKSFFKKYIGLDIKNADITQDLNIKQTINLPDNSVDMVILSNILEHLTDPSVLISESRRIARKYIIVGLPNEYPLDKRIYILFGKWEDWVYIYGHKHRFSISSIERFVKENFGSYIKKKLCFQCRGGEIYPKSSQKIFSKNFSKLVCRRSFLSN